MNTLHPVFKFPRRLTKATILSRPNRYVAKVKLTSGEIVKAYVPVGGRIGGLTIDGLNCLLSGAYPHRNTLYTVEALELEKQWVGINQNAGNTYVKHFLENGFLSELTQLTVDETKRVLNPEKTLLNSRIDFQLGASHETKPLWIEVKTPLIELHTEIPENVPVKTDYGTVAPSMRMPQQIENMLSRVADGDRAVLLGLFLYVNDKTSHKERFLANLDVDGLATQGAKKNLESWSLECRFSPDGVTFNSLERIL